MNTIDKFINFTKKCPNCDNDLKLYMSWSNSVLFKGTTHSVDDPTYIFKKHPVSEGETPKLLMCGETVNLIDLQLSALIESRKVYLFQICNEKAIVHSNSYNEDYHIQAEVGCYYRSSPLMKFNSTTDAEWSLATIESHKNLNMKNECFAFKKYVNSIEYNYVLNIDYGNKSTYFWYYTASKDERAQIKFRPKVFERRFPLLDIRPKFNPEDREQLLKRFDSWVILS